MHVHDVLLIIYMYSFGRFSMLHPPTGSGTAVGPPEDEAQPVCTAAGLGAGQFVSLE